MNAILNKNTENLKGCKVGRTLSCSILPLLAHWLALRRPAQMYVALFPCNECAKLIIQSGIAQVIYRSDKYHDR